MQIQVGTVRLSCMSDQPVDPLAATPRICARIDDAWPQVGEWNKIIEKLMRTKVRIMPASATGQGALEAGFALARPRRLRVITVSAVMETKSPCIRPNRRKLGVRPCHKPMISMFNMMHKTSSGLPECP